MQSVLNTSNIRHKIALIEEECHQLLLNKQKYFVMPTTPARDATVLPNNLLTKRVGLQSIEGQARLLHDLANIELQAMELGLRTLHEFTHAPMDFREQLAAITIEESKHLALCLEGIEDLGYSWGFTPVHTNLWDATDSKDTWSERIFIVHCYLEGSGLDSGEIILEKLSGVSNKKPKTIVKKIAQDEVAHVQFGLHWLNKSHNASNVDFRLLLTNLKQRLPSRAAKISRSARLSVGFTEEQILALNEFKSL